MFIWQQLVQLLSQPPGSVVYHIVTLLALQATFGLALWQSRRQPADTLARRLAWASGGILLSRLVIFFVVLTAGPEVGDILPPLERAVDAATVALLVYALAPHYRGLPRLGDVSLIIVLLLIGFMFLFFAQEWQDQLTGGAAPSSYAGSVQAQIWAVLQVGILAIGVVLTVAARQAQWALRLIIFTIPLLANLATLWLMPANAVGETEAAYWVRLANLLVFPLLAVLAYRHNLSQLVPAQETQRSAGQLSSLLQLSRNLIRQPDLDSTTDQSLALAAELTAAEFAALAVVAPERPDHLFVASRHLQPRAAPPPDSGDSSPFWALRLSDWPAINLAMQQRQQIELLPNGLGARQLHNLYQELDIAQTGALLIEPLLIDDEEAIGVLLLAGPPEQERWTTNDKTLSSALAAFVAQAVLNSQKYEQVVSGSQQSSAEQLAALRAARDQAEQQIEHLSGRISELEADLSTEKQRARELSKALRAAEQARGNGRLRSLEEETEALRKSLTTAETTIALAAAGQAKLSADWVMRAVTRYSGELEDAQARISYLESQLNQRRSDSALARIAEHVRELRTPLTSVSSYTDLLLGESLGILGTKQLTLLHRMQANIKKLTSTLEEIIWLSQRAAVAEAGTIQVDVREAIEMAVNAVSDQLQDKGIILELDVAEELPKFQCENDSLYQVIVHLLQHACQVSEPETRVTVSAHHDSLLEPFEPAGRAAGGFLHLAVRDSGGVKSQRLHNMVLEHQREPDNEALQDRLANGGHSLSVAMDLIANFGGRTWVAGEENDGTTFSVLLPVSANGSN